MIRLFKTLSPAKINLILRVGPERKDGFHAVETLMGKMAWGDNIKLKIKQSSALKIKLKCNEASIENNKNLAVRAAQLFAERLPIFFETEIHIRKKIPMEGGLAGGSSNAASVLKILKEWYLVEFGKSDRMERIVKKIAQDLGSDVQFFLSKSNGAWCTGRGEKCKDFSVADWPAVLVFPKTKISTAWAYGSLDKHRKRLAIQANRRLVGASPKGSDWRGSLIVPGLENDFETPMIEQFAELGRLKTDLAQSRAIAGQMTGSGSCFFGLYFTEKQAKQAEQLMASKGWKTQRTKLQSL